MPDELFEFPFRQVDDRVFLDQIIDDRGDGHRLFARFLTHAARIVQHDGAKDERNCELKRSESEL